MSQTRCNAVPELFAKAVIPKWSCLGMQRISGAAYVRRLGLLSCTSAAWSRLCKVDEPPEDHNAGTAPLLACSMLAIGTKSGRIWVWRQLLPAPSHLTTPPELVPPILRSHCSVR